MQTELALQKLTEAREAVDGETAELIDSLARVIILQKDLRSPMIGAKVTLYTRPATETFMLSADQAPNNWEESWQFTTSTNDEEYWSNWDYDWYYDEPEDPDEVIQFREKKNKDDSDVVAHQALVIEGNIAESAPDENLWDPNKQEYNRPEDYPSGTVNCVVAYPYDTDVPQNQHVEIDQILNFEEDYPTNVAVFTSVTPAVDEPHPHEYTPGWSEE